MSQFTMNNEISLSDLLTLVAIVISVYFGIKAMFDVARTEKKSNTQRMLDRWNSDSFARHKALAGQMLRERGDNSGAPIFIGDLMDSKPRADEYLAVSEMSHFFSDLNSLWKERALDDRLTCALFGRPIEFWWQWFGRIDSRSGPEDQSTPHADVNKWRREYVVPLYAHLKEAQKRCEMKAQIDG